ncbi:hypothetical protein HHUSO_G32481, partial [Huso huso]
ITNGSVGFVALVISLIIDIVPHKVKQQQVVDVKDQIRSIFAEEKVSEIGNLVAEYIKRVQLHLDNPGLLAEDTFHYERLLSLQLTRVEKSMLKDGQMNEKALKYWLNGATVHSHMVIQLVRMGKVRKTASVTASQLYNDQLPDLLDSYRDYLLKTLYVSKGNYFPWWLCTPDNSCRHLPGDIQFKNSKVAYHWIYFYGCEMAAVKKSIVNQIMESQQIRNAREFFKKTIENMDKLINQRGDFQISQSPLRKKRWSNATFINGNNAKNIQVNHHLKKVRIKHI